MLPRITLLISEDFLVSRLRGCYMPIRFTFEIYFTLFVLSFVDFGKQNSNFYQILPDFTSHVGVMFASFQGMLITMRNFPFSVLRRHFQIEMATTLNFQLLFTGMVSETTNP